ncbi:CGNR zinc finger domain-containing protein [Umezawaea sp. Da 62-37]|uniref:CGNR zinc finger domain-containing protein n=1 Tax=Umezawaea sp. Da 62-37 TaxID=3075927 RepID=UPI0028F7395D|nr:CGNR zinc finger domain-containing protein [Umezawaea sp. Da 62-37]WNV88914.1 CGNR zinc finger domain-containing protein [Umezawaea sp. Da 62-37]
MMWPATERHGLTPAPSGLALVQDLLNTTTIGGNGFDLLSDTATTRTWVGAAVAAWTATTGREWVAPKVDDNDRVALRALRDTVTAMVEGDEVGGVQRSVTLGVALSPDGIVDLEPRGDGWRPIASAVFLECFLAQRVDTWKRVKTCANPPCAAAFYDHSRNNSGVWHDVKVCGNAVNLRASRARRRTG